MDKNLILRACNENWSLKRQDDWDRVIWYIFSDGTYRIETGFVPRLDLDNYVRREGKMSSRSFQQLTEAMSSDWDFDPREIDACDGEAWAVDQYENGNLVRSSGPIGYVYGKEAIEKIIELLPCQEKVYEKKYKQVFDRLAEDGCRIQRSIRRDSNLIRCAVKYNFTFVPFAMDMEREDFIILMLPRKKELSVFVWVYLNEEDGQKRVRITAVNDLMLYTKWTGEPMDVSGKYSDKTVKKAIAILSDYSNEQLWMMFEEMKEKMGSIGGAEAWKKSELELMKTVEEAKAYNNGAMYMY